MKRAIGKKRIKKAFFMFVFGCVLACTVMVATENTVYASELAAGNAELMIEGILGTEEENYVDESKLIPIYETWSKRFVKNSMMKDVGRAIGWNGIVKPLTWLAEKSQNLYENTLGLVDFTNWGSGNYKNSAMRNFISNLKYIFTAVLAISLVYLGIVLIVDHEKRPKIFTSIVLAAFCFAGLGWALEEVNSLIPDLAMNIIGEENTSIAQKTVQSNLFDLYYMEQQAGGLDNLPTEADDSDFGISTYNMNSTAVARNSVKEMWEYIDFTEVVSPDSEFLSFPSNDKVLSYYLTYTPTANGKETGSIVSINDGMKLLNDSQGNGMFNDYYYRYTINWFPSVVALISVLILFICMAYKVVRLIIEIAIYRVLALLFSAELTGTQRTLRILRGIVDSYIILLLSAVLIKIYYFAEEFLSAQFNNQPFVYCVLLLFVTMAVIDGPNLVQQVTGIDAGISSVAGRMMGGLYAANMAGHTAAGVARGGAAAGRALGGAARSAGQNSGRNADAGAATGAAAGAASGGNGGKGQLNENGDEKAKKEPNTDDAEKKTKTKTPAGSAFSSQSVKGKEIDEGKISPQDSRDKENKQMDNDLNKDFGGRNYDDIQSMSAMQARSGSSGTMHLNQDQHGGNISASYDDVQAMAAAQALRNGGGGNANAQTEKHVGGAGLNENVNTNVPDSSAGGRSSQAAHHTSNAGLNDNVNKNNPDSSGSGESLY